MADEYRIRWAICTTRRGRTRMCIAERKVRLFGIPLFWFPTDGDWRLTEDEARRDAAYDAELRRPLPKPISV